MKVFEIDGVKPEDYINSIYVPPTLSQFIGMWEKNVDRARQAAEEIKSQTNSPKN